MMQITDHKTLGGRAGFTLVELVIVIAILGVLAALAYPTYTRYVAASARADAQSALLNTAQQLERCYTENNSYQGCIDFAGLESENGHYQLRAADLTQTTFRIRAVPVDVQAERDSHRCSFLELEHTGRRYAEDDGGDDETEECWGT